MFSRHLAVKQDYFLASVVAAFHWEPKEGEAHYVGNNDPYSLNMETCLTRAHWTTLAGTKMAYSLLSMEQKPRINMPALECCRLVIEMDIFRHLFIYDNFCGGVGAYCLPLLKKVYFVGEEEKGSWQVPIKCNYAG